LGDLLLELLELWERARLVVDKDGILLILVLLLVDEFLDVVVIVSNGSFHEDCGESLQVDGLFESFEGFFGGKGDVKLFDVLGNVRKGLFNVRGVVALGGKSSVILMKSLHCK